MNLKDYIHAFGSLKALVVGDIMLDSYITGGVNRVSPEAPVPVINFEHNENMLGGGANVALNLKSLGAQVSVCSVIGKDKAADKIKTLFLEHSINSNYLIESKQRITTQKTRIIGNGYQMLRVDKEDSSFLSEELEHLLVKSIIKSINDTPPDVLIFQDYDKGVLTPIGIKTIIQLCQKKNIPIAVDPKKRSFLNYKGVNLFKPNLQELSEGIQYNIEPTNKKSLELADKQLRRQLKHDISLITLSEHGIYVSRKEENSLLPAYLRNISDVSGAGDTVLSVASLMLALKASIQDIAKLANLAGGLACEKVGIYSITPKALIEELEKIND